jgi:hypothetical protein
MRNFLLVWSLLALLWAMVFNIFAPHHDALYSIFSSDRHSDFFPHLFLQIKKDYAEM